MTKIGEVVNKNITAGRPLSKPQIESKRVMFDGKYHIDDYRRNGDYLRHDIVFQEEPERRRGTKKIDPHQNRLQEEIRKEELTRQSNARRAAFRAKMEIRGETLERYGPQEDFKPSLRRISPPIEGDKLNQSVLNTEYRYFYNTNLLKKRQQLKQDQNSRVQIVDIISHRSDDDIAVSCRYGSFTRKRSKEADIYDSRPEFLHHSYASTPIPNTFEERCKDKIQAPILKSSFQAKLQEKLCAKVSKPLLSTNKEEKLMQRIYNPITGRDQLIEM